MTRQTYLTKTRLDRVLLELTALVAVRCRWTLRSFRTDHHQQSSDAHARRLELLEAAGLSSDTRILWHHLRLLDEEEEGAFTLSPLY